MPDKDLAISATISSPNAPTGCGGHLLRSPREAILILSGE
jgi:hypothetical protein